MTTRRIFLRNLALLAAAPAVVRAGSLMRVNPRLVVPMGEIITTAKIGSGLLTIDQITRKSLQILDELFTALEFEGQYSHELSVGDTIRIKRL